MCHGIIGKDVVTTDWWPENISSFAIGVISKLYLLLLVSFPCWAAPVNEGTVDIPTPPDSVHFTFKPPIGRPYWIVTDHETITDYEGNKRTSMEHSVRKVSVERDSLGFHLMFDPDTVIYLQNDEPVDNPLLEAAKKARPTIHVDSMGYFLDVTSRADSQEIAGIISKMDTAVVNKLVEKKLPEFIRERQRQEWSFYYETFSGQAVAIGDGFVIEGESPLIGDVSMKMTTTILIDTLMRCCEDVYGPCVRIRYLTESVDVGSMQKMIRNLSRGEESEAEADSAIEQISGMSLEIYGEILMDPSTMLIFDETQTREVNMGKVGGMPDAGWRRDDLHRFLRWNEKP